MIVKGPQIPSGKVKVSGAKNAATRMMAASMLTNDIVYLLNFPTELVDVRHKSRFIEALSGKINFDKKSSLASFDCSKLKPKILGNYDFPIRTTYLLAAGQLLREGKAFIPYPGGCNLGTRKYDLHIMVWETLGCKVLEKENYIEITGTLSGADIYFPISTVGGTENALLCASIAKGKTRIYNSYVTPEVQNLIDLLILMGAKITVRGNSLIEIEGVSSLRGATIKVIPDRIEALTWIIFAAISQGNILVENVPFNLMEIPLLHLKNSGLDFFANSNSIWVSKDSIPDSGLQPFEVACGTHPGIISDMQPFYVLLALHSKGRSLVIDYRYPERTAYLEQLSQIYPNSMEWKEGKISINCNTKPIGGSVISTDLRGSMALLLAGLIAHGETHIDKIQMALRGYDCLEEKLNGLGIKTNIN
ncbi:UDP-N-acetylglucosamine 1-carboxyvinyltransferase [Cyanobacterium aponinum FACHB-4101]|nr:UDP-N-acetylglucosamine 1-carboxyvinyltransferase [Cyanobacterium aponinum FACHB-4101]